MEKKKTATKKVQEPTRNSKKSIIVGIAVLFVVMLILLGLTYAYYRTRVIGNDKNTLSVVSKLLEIKYEDGSATMNMDGLIEPDFTYEKTFSVRNTGDESVTYAVYFEEVINTFVNKGDVSFEVTCTSNDGSTCNGVDATTYPEENTKLVSNTIGYDATKEVVHTYTLKVNYPETNKDQSDNMGKQLAGKVQIYDESVAVDIEGTIAGANTGDYVEINSKPKKSQIVGGRYKLTAVELGTHTLYVKDKNGNIRGQATLTINKGTQGASGSTITIDDASQTATLNIKTISATLGIEITKVGKEETPGQTWDTAKEGTLLYAIKRDNTVTSPKTTPGQSASAADEAVLAMTEDDYGPSYYFRGTVTNNYVNYSGMCWRIVRVDGNSNIKLVLADDQNECNDGYSLNNSSSAFIKDGSDLKVVGYNTMLVRVEGLSFASSEVPTALNDWASQMNLNTSELFTAEWCSDMSIGDVEVQEHAMGVVNAYTLGAAKRLSSPSLKCPKQGLNNIENIYKNTLGLLNADEIIFAGSGNENLNYYLQANADSTLPDFGVDFNWTLSPAYITIYERTGSIATSPKVLILDSTGKIISDDTAFAGVVRPAIVIKSTALASTNSDINSYGEPGTYTNPYVID